MNFNLKLTENEVNLIIGALSKMPFDAVHQLIPNIVSQIKEQAPKQDRKLETVK